jgi:hypothetical protein
VTGNDPWALSGEPFETVGKIVAKITRLRLVSTLTLASVPASAQVESVNLWNAGIGGYATYRIPGIVVTKRGTILAYCGGRKDLSKGDWSPADVLLRRSTDGGRTWGPSRMIAGNGKDLTDNVVAIVDRQTGAIHIRRARAAGNALSSYVLPAGGVQLIAPVVAAAPIRSAFGT